ncbi:MAG: DUF4974 domain-containing protein [Odoribacter sp.]
MDIIKDHQRICELLSKEITYGLNAVEEKELEIWRKESADNDELYDRLVDSTHISLWEQKKERIDIGKSWKKLETIIHISNRWRLGGKYGWRYAAIIILFLGIGGGVFWQTNRIKEQKTILVKEIIPGTLKAKLFLGDGRCVELANKRKEVTIKQNGVWINNDSTGLKYVEKEVKKDQNIRHKLVIPRGGEYQVTLEDGTIIFLNSESSINYPTSFANNLREVYLEGEAYFRVSRDTNRPFIVKTKNMDICVLGTEFNVKAYQEEEVVTTTLVKGAVRIATGITKDYVQVLKPDQQAIFFKNNQSLKVNDVDVNYIIAWKNGQFIFKDERLEDIMTVLSRWYDFDVFYQNETLKNLVFAGKLNRMGTIDPILDIIKSTQKLTIQIKGKSIVLSEK